MEVENFLQRSLYMKKSRFTDSQIVAVLKEVELGARVGETCRKHGISEPTYYMYGLPVECNGLAARPMS